MKNKILLIALFVVFVPFSYTADQKRENQKGTLALLEYLPVQIMPKAYWSHSPSTEFKTFEDAINIAKINALCFGLEDEEGIKGAASFYSGCMHAASSLKTDKKSYDLAILECFLQEFPLASQNDECLSIQLIANDLKVAIGDQKEVEKYSRWIQEHKNPIIVRNIVSFIDVYIKTRTQEAIDSLYRYIKQNIE